MDHMERAILVRVEVLKTQEQGETIAIFNCFSIFYSILTIL